MKIIDTGDENIKYHAMKNIIYRRKIMKMYYAMQEIKKQEIISPARCVTS